MVNDRSPEMDDGLPIPPDPVEHAALEALLSLIQVNAGLGSRFVAADGETVPIPASVLRALRQVVEPLARGRLVTVGHQGRDMSVAEVARLVRLPRPDVMRMIDEGSIPSSISHGMRTVRFEDAMVLMQQRDVERRAALQWLSDQGQEIDHLLGDFLVPRDEDATPIGAGTDALQRQSS